MRFKNKKRCGCGCGCGSKYFKVAGTGALAVEEIKKYSGSGAEKYQRTVISLVRPAFGFQAKAVTA